MRTIKNSVSIILKKIHFTCAVTVAVFIFVTNVTAYNDELLFHFEPRRLNDISCHTIFSHDSIPAVDDEEFPEKSIFFIETSCTGGLDSRQACAVEAAARAHPGWQINVLFAGPVSGVFLNGDKLFDLQEFDNIKVRRIHIIKYAKGTPLESNLTRIYGLLNISNFPVHLAADVLRMLTLYKFGGVYLDLDMITVKSFNNLPRNWVARELNPNLGSAVLAVAKTGLGRVFSEAALRDLAINFHPHLWNHNGPGVVTRVLQKLCTTKNLVVMQGETCHGFEVFLDKYFYPIDYYNWKDYFKPGELKYDRAFTHHLWNILSHGSKVPKDSLFAKLAKNYCPTIYETYGDKFGSMRYVPD